MGMFFEFVIVTYFCCAMAEKTAVVFVGDAEQKHPKVYFWPFVYQADFKVSPEVKHRCSTNGPAPRFGKTIAFPPMGGM